MLNCKSLIISIIFSVFVGLFAQPWNLSAAPLDQTKSATATPTSTKLEPTKALKPTIQLPTATAQPTKKRIPTATSTPAAAQPALTATATISASLPITTGEQGQTADPSQSEVISATATALPAAVATDNGPPFDWSTSENYLILGTDRRPDWTDWRTDTIILVGIDRVNQRAAAFSIPRDLYVQIPGYGMARINQVDYMGERRNGAGGGPVLVSQVLNDVLGVSAQHWVRVQMDGFVSFVDAVGGVTVTLDCPFSEPIFNLTTQRWDEFTLPAGDNLLDGEDAYWFVRLRLRESDIGRANRQRQFLWALRNKVLNTNLIARAPELWSAFSGTFSTDLNFFQILEVGSFTLRLEPQNVRASGLTLADLQNFVTADGQQVLRIGNPERVRAKVANVWAAPAMVDSNRHDAATCQPLPDPGTLNLPPPGTASSTAGSGTAGSGTAPATADNQANTSPADLPPSKNANPNLAIGKRVRIRKGYTLQVRSQAGEEAGKVLGTMADGEQAVILNGSIKTAGAGDTIVWWYVRTDGGEEGWVPANTGEAPLLDPVQ